MNLLAPSNSPSDPGLAWMPAHRSGASPATAWVGVLGLVALTVLVLATAAAVLAGSTVR